MKSFGRIVMLSTVLAIVSTSWLGCVVDSGTSPSVGTAPRISTSTLPSGTVGTTYSQTLRASGDAPITWSLESGALPAGLNLLRSGTISGTPTTAGTYNFSVDASNSAGSDVASFSITITGGSTTQTSYSLDGIWEVSNGMLINANGSVGVFSAFGTPSAVMQSAIDKGYIKLGDQRWRNIKSTGNLTWSGQTLNIQYNASNVATGTIWRDCTFSLSADGQTLTHVYPTSDGTTTTMTTATYTRVSTYSLDGVWEGSNGMRINANGSVGVFGAFGTTSAVMQSAIDKGYIKLGDQRWRNITRTGNLTWSGQTLNIQYNASNVATGTIWRDCTFSMSADGQTLTHVYPITEVGGTTTMTTVTYTRIQ